MHDFATVVEHVSLDWIFAKTPRGNRQNLLVLSCAFWISLAAKIYYRGKKNTKKQWYSLFSFVFPRIWCFLVLWGVARQNRPVSHITEDVSYITRWLDSLVLFFFCFVNLVFI